MTPTRAQLDAAGSEAMTADEWNAAHPVGTAVRYWPVMPKREGEAVDTATRSEAWSSPRGGVFLGAARKARANRLAKHGNRNNRHRHLLRD